MTIFKKLFHKRTRVQSDYDFLPLFFWDKGLSNTAKIIMCLAGGGEENREKTLCKLKETFSPDMVNSIEQALHELEDYGYLTCESYRGEYGESRVDRRLCICPPARLPKLVQPTGAPLRELALATDMYDTARDLGFIAETGVDTTYLLYDALRIFSAVESALDINEFVILPLIGTESVRKDISVSKLSEYPQCVIAAVITTRRLLFVQEDCSAKGRKAGMARFIVKTYDDIQTVALDENCGRIYFETWHPDDWDGRIVVDLITPFALENFPRYYNEAMAFLPSNSKMPRLSYRKAKVIFDDA